MAEWREHIIVIAVVLGTIAYLLAKIIRVKVGAGVGPLVFQDVFNDFSVLGEIAGELPAGAKRASVHAVRWTLVISFLAVVLSIAYGFIT
jgi:hypothetical protein